MVDFSYLWLQEDMSDIEFVLSTPDNTTQPPTKRRRTEHEHNQPSTVLRRFPGHKVLLGQSPYFKAQIQRWRQQGPAQAVEPSSSMHSSDGIQNSSSSSSSCVVSLVLDSSEDEAAAMAVLGQMYGVQPDPSLPDVQLLQMVLLADMLQVQDIAQQAVLQLHSAVWDSGGMSEQLQEKMLAMQAWPACLLTEFESLTVHMPLGFTAALWMNAAALQPGSCLEAVLAAPHRLYMQQRLLSVLYDLHAVWVDANLQQLLLELPMPALQLLLASDNLRVPSEDIVLYTAHSYLVHQHQQQRQQ